MGEKEELTMNLEELASYLLAQKDPFAITVIFEGKEGDDGSE